jgi:hypothetical protein
VRADHESSRAFLVLALLALALPGRLPLVVHQNGDLEARKIR